MPVFPFYKQLDMMDCGPTCLRMIAKHYGKNFSLQNLRERCYITREGVSFLGISDAAESIGIHTIGAKVTYEQLKNEVPLPCIVHWSQKHFVVVYKIRKGKVYVADPAQDKIVYAEKDFLKEWLSTSRAGSDKGLVLMMQPTPDFYKQDDEKIDKTSFRFLWSYLKPHKKYLWQLVLGLLLGSIFQLIFPFLTQSVVDIGINNQDIGFITLVLIAQLVLFVSQITVELIRSWILLHLSTRINISLISDFLVKLMKLPIGFFDSKMIGDMMQRIGDHTRIERFLTTNTLNVAFSFFSMFIFAIVLAIYSWQILLIFLLGSILYIVWIVFFLKRRKELDYKRFIQLSDNQSKLIELITGMQEIKLNNSEKQKRWEWERIQAKLFQVNIRRLSLTQIQTIGSGFINQLKNILIAFLAARFVIEGQMTLGAMMAVSYIIGQMNGPIEGFMNFIQNAQDAKISVERLGEIHQRDDEEADVMSKITVLPENKSLVVKNLTFQYEGPHSPKVLKNINLEIPAQKTTAIVGMSGSGKTTLLKMLLGFYKPVEGEVKVGDIRIENISQSIWRNKCGVVMQDGFIFSDSILKNIAVGQEFIDKTRLYEAVKLANIQDFIESLPIGFNTVIGQSGVGLSQGQKQRVLIARAIYKNPDYLLFDEATNALDANNEKAIMENMGKIAEGKTVVVVAHRLSTVKNADKIVVLDAGEIVEEGTHEQLINIKGKYYHLVKNQLELGS